MLVVDWVVDWPGAVCVVVVEVVCATMQTLSDSTEMAAPSFEYPVINFSFEPGVLFPVQIALSHDPESKMPTLHPRPSARFRNKFWTTQATLEHRCRRPGPFTHYCGGVTLVGAVEVGVPGFLLFAGCLERFASGAPFCGSGLVVVGRVGSVGVPAGVVGGGVAGIGIEGSVAAGTGVVGLLGMRGSDGFVGVVC